MEEAQVFGETQHLRRVVFWMHESVGSITVVGIGIIGTVSIGGSKDLVGLHVPPQFPKPSPGEHPGRLQHRNLPVPLQGPPLVRQKLVGPVRIMPRGVLRSAIEGAPQQRRSTG